jgi:hypothetical protein
MQSLDPRCPRCRERMEQLRRRQTPQLPEDYRRKLEQMFADCCGAPDGDLSVRGQKR